MSVLNALYGTLFTWGLTALGSAVVFFVPPGNRLVLDVSLGFSAGVMLAASYWSLLAPALELSVTQGWGAMACIPVSIGLILGSAFVLVADLSLPSDVSSIYTKPKEESPIKEQYSDHTKVQEVSELRYRGNKQSAPDTKPSKEDSQNDKNAQIRRLILLIIAITVHNFPEGLAVGVGYGSVGKHGVTIQQAHNLAIGIGLQNFPEGLAVSVPLRAAGFSTMSSFFWGQLSGMVEPIAGVLGALAVNVAEWAMPISLAFAAGAMIWVVFSEIVPESAQSGNSRACSVGAMIGFIVMMSLDTSLS